MKWMALYDFLFGFPTESSSQEPKMVIYINTDIYDHTKVVLESKTTIRISSNHDTIRLQSSMGSVIEWYVQSSYS